MTFKFITTLGRIFIPATEMVLRRRWCLPFRERRGKEKLKSRKSNRLSSQPSYCVELSAPHLGWLNHIATMDKFLLKFTINFNRRKWWCTQLDPTSSWRGLVHSPAAPICSPWLLPFRTCGRCQDNTVRKEIKWFAKYWKLNFDYVKFKRADRKSRTTPPLSGPDNPLGLPLQSGWNKLKVTSFLWKIIFTINVNH
jgi:hypothetical protein